jgi:N-acetylneuraminate synthase
MVVTVVPVTSPVRIGSRLVGPGEPTYVIAEISANHGQSYNRALELVHIAKDAGADAVKLQTYTADTLTIDADLPPFRIKEGTLWSGRKLHDLYAEAFTPWEWQPRLKAEADALGIHLFSTPFDATAVEFLEAIDPPAHKIASFELVDHALIAKVASTGRPMIMSTGMATTEEIDAAVEVARSAGAGGLVLLRCNSAYPANAAEMDLRTIPDMVERWNVPVGLSDHTLGSTSAITAVVLGACVVEKHITFSRSEPGPDAAFSLEPAEFSAFVGAVREAEASLGRVRYGPSPSERPSLAFRRSLFVVSDIAAGELFTTDNVRSIRPADGLSPADLPRVLARRAARAISRGTPLSWELISD